MSEVQTLARGLRVLDMLAASPEPVGVTQLAKEMGVDKGSMSRLVQTLVKYDFAERDEKTRRYRLGRKIKELNEKMERHTSLPKQAQSFLQQLVEKTGENAHLAIHAEGKVLIVADVESPATLRVVSGVGRKIALHCTAVGKCLLAFNDIPLPDHLPQLTPFTITKYHELSKHLQEIRHAGFAIDDEEHLHGVRCLAAPIYNYSGQPIASIGISGPAVRVTQETLPQLSKIVIEIAAELSRELGWKKR